MKVFLAILEELTQLAIRGGTWDVGELEGGYASIRAPAEWRNATGTVSASGGETSAQTFAHTIPLTLNGQRPGGPTDYAYMGAPLAGYPNLEYTRDGQLKALATPSVFNDANGDRKFRVMADAQVSYSAPGSRKVELEIEVKHARCESGGGGGQQIFYTSGQTAGQTFDVYTGDITLPRGSDCAELPQGSPFEVHPYDVTLRIRASEFQGRRWVRSGGGGVHETRFGTSQQEETTQTLLVHTPPGEAPAAPVAFWGMDFEDPNLPGWDRTVRGGGRVESSPSARTGRRSMLVGGRWADVAFASAALAQTPGIPYTVEFWFRLDRASDFNGYRLWHPQTAEGKPCDLNVQIHEGRLLIVGARGERHFRRHRFPVGEWLRFVYLRKDARLGRLEVYSSRGPLLFAVDEVVRDGDGDGNPANDRIGRVSVGDMWEQWWRGFVYYDDLRIYEGGAPIPTPTVPIPTVRPTREPRP